MLFREILDIPCGIRFMLENLNLQSSYSRNLLLHSPMMAVKEDIERTYSILSSCYSRLYSNGGANTSSSLAALKHRLMGLRDITGTLERLQRGVVLDDLDLFEIKYTAILAGYIRDAVYNMKLEGVDIPDLGKVISVLDPDGMLIESFYVYDSYSKELGRIRADIRGLQALSDPTAITQDRLLELLEKERLLERDIRENLSAILKNHTTEIKAAMDAMGYLDLLLAKCLQIKTMGLCIPVISGDSTTQYRGMFHPYVVHLYEKENATGGHKKIFQPVDIKFGIESLSIIGANMGGKSVVLKMTALNQLLFQFGFGVAARSAVIDIKEEIRLCIGDDQDLHSGLSSFAGEVKAIDNVIRRINVGKKMLALIDEPARTTNPIEGTALVTALLDILRGKNLSLLLTTHYNISGDFFRRLRVRGLVSGKMDYTLVETTEGEIPQEAINVARSLGVDELWLTKAEQILKT